MQNKKQSWFVITTILLVLLLIGIVVVTYIQLAGNPFSSQSLALEENSRETLGWVGDFFGGILNPILAFLSFIALLYTLKLNQEELNETRKELKRAADAQEDSKQLLNEQLKTQFLQQFNSFFSTLLTQLNHKIDRLSQNGILDRLHQQIEHLHDHDEIYELQELKNLFDFIYLTLYSTDSKIDSAVMLSDSEKQELKFKYWMIVRSLTPEKVLHLLLRDITENHEDKRIAMYVALIEKSQFFENLSFYGLDAYKHFWLLWATGKFNAAAFGENEGYEEIQHNKVYLLIQQINSENLGKFLYRCMTTHPLKDLNHQQLEELLKSAGLTELSFQQVEQSDDLDVYYQGMHLNTIDLQGECLYLHFYTQKSAQVAKTELVTIIVKFNWQAHDWQATLEVCKEN